MALALRLEGGILPAMKDLKLADAAANAAEHVTLENARITWERKETVCSFCS